MYKILYRDQQEEVADLDSAMNRAKELNEFVTISGQGYEIVGRFGVDSIADGKCPDGIAYDWNKSSRIGATKRRT